MYTMYSQYRELYVVALVGHSSATLRMNRVDCDLLVLCIYVMYFVTSHHSLMYTALREPSEGNPWQYNSVYSDGCAKSRYVIRAWSTTKTPLDALFILPAILLTSSLFLFSCHASRGESTVVGLPPRKQNVIGVIFR